MIIIVIGQSGSGKTTLCKNRFIKEPYEIRQDITTYTECGNGVVAIGKYGINIREEGTDTLPYNSQDKIVEQVKKLIQNGKTVLIEGDRISSKRVFDELAKTGAECKLYLISCSIKTSMERLRKANSKISKSFVKSTKTKTRRLYFEYKDIFNGEIIKEEGT